MKVFAGQTVHGGEIIVRQRGTRFKPGDGAGLGRDHTIFAKRAGTVEFAEGHRGRTISVSQKPSSAAGRTAGAGPAPLTSRARVRRQGTHLGAGRAGGDGSTSFRREAHVPKGGPDGGDGGRGGDVVLVCDASRRDLGAFRRGAHFRAKRGGHGEGNQRHGANAATLEVPVPPGHRGRGRGARAPAGT